MEGAEYRFPSDKKELYKTVNTYIKGLTNNVPHLIANLSNASALLNLAMERINWVGFYLMEEGKLVLGPFQGKPACIEIESGRGVCGTAIAQDACMLVKDVHEFPGHIACDSASNSEVVIPLHANGTIVGVLDIDSPFVARFDEEDLEGLKLIAQTIEKMWEK